MRDPYEKPYELQCDTCLLSLSVVGGAVTSCFASHLIQSARSNYDIQSTGQKSRALLALLLHLLLLLSSSTSCMTLPSLMLRRQEHQQHIMIYSTLHHMI